MQTQIIHAQSISLLSQKLLFFADIARTPPKTPLNYAKTVNSSGGLTGRKENGVYGGRMENIEGRVGCWEDRFGVWE